MIMPLQQIGFEIWNFILISYKWNGDKLKKKSGDDSAFHSEGWFDEYKVDVNHMLWQSQLN